MNKANIYTASLLTIVLSSVVVVTFYICFVDFFEIIMNVLMGD